MRILHIFQRNDELQAKHVSILLEGMQNSAEIKSADAPSEAKAIIREWKPEIVHCHGCWTYWTVNAGRIAIKKGARIVISPHGQLEPWVTEEKVIHEKLPKTALWQKSFVEKAYSVIAFGKMEEKYLRQLKWNPRIEVIKNSVITNSISQQEMCSETFTVYQKVMDSNVLELMDENSLKLMATIIKIGILGDQRWTKASKESETIPNVSSEDWRRILIYAEHENIRNYVDYGINILGLTTPHVDTEKIPAYFPEQYKRPQTIKHSIGEYNGYETEYLIKMIRQIQKEPLLLHIIELTRELYRDNVNDDELREALEEHKLAKYASRLIQVLQEQALLDEGYMPLEPTDDRGTQQIRNKITNHLKI